METFEIHITGSPNIIDELTQLGIKNIIVELLTPDMKVLRTEFMSSFIAKHESLDHCKAAVVELITKLKSDIIRVKIESPYYEHYKDISLYLESHFKPIEAIYPISRNLRSQKLMATDRTYDKNQYEAFRTKWGGEDVEMCLCDTFVEEDFDWFELYENLAISGNK